MTADARLLATELERCFAMAHKTGWNWIGRPSSIIEHVGGLLRDYLKWSKTREAHIKRLEELLIDRGVTRAELFSIWREFNG